MENIAAIVQKQREYFNSHRTRNIDGRIAQLKKLKKLLIAHQDELLIAVYQDLGKSKFEGLVVELVSLYEEIDLFCAHLKDWAKTEKVSSPLHLQSSHGKIIKEPYGLVSVFAPWNYPIQLVLSPAIGSIAAGNCTILKPADLSSHSQAALIKLINKNFDPGFLTVIGGGIPKCEELLKEKMDYIFFTGSPRVGKIILKAAAEHLTPVCLELGGKSPCIIDETANLEIAARRITWGKLLNAGQTCVAPDYFYVHKNIKQEFLTALKKEIERVYGAQPINNEKLCKIISPQHFQRVTDLIDKEKVFFGGQSDPNSQKIEPTILDNVNWSDPIMGEEIFGPLLPILEYENIDAPIKIINEKPKPLALYLFSENKSIQQKVFANTSSGGGCINDCLMHLGNPKLPFGGVGNSGMGAYHGRHSFELLSHRKGVLTSSTSFDNPMRYPSQIDSKTKLIKYWFKAK